MEMVPIEVHLIVVGGVPRGNGVVPEPRGDRSCPFWSSEGYGSCAGLPSSVLSRGFALVRDSGGAVVTSAAVVGLGDRLRVAFHDGEANVTVNGVSRYDEEI